MIKTDSLENGLFSEEDPQKKMGILIEITEQLMSFEPDRVYDYANQTMELEAQNNNLESKHKGF